MLFILWSEIDIEAKTWTLPAERMKAGEEHTVFLSEPALAILAEQGKLQRALVFPSLVRGKEAMSKMAMLAVLGRLGVRYTATVHGLCRASFSTWAHETAAARPEVIEACLAHQEQDRVRRAYNRATFNDERRMLMAAWSAFVTSRCDGANVISLKA